jgi:hypothetical protein
MHDVSSQNDLPGKAKAPGRPTDAVAKWKAEAGAAPAPLAEVRLDPSERLLIPFTTDIVEAQVHYLDFPSLRGYVACNGDGCLLCRVGQRADARDLLPVYDPLARAVAVLPVSPSMRPGALRPQLFPVLARLKADSRVLLVVRKPDRTHHEVTLQELPGDADAGEDQVADFLEAYEAGGIDLGAVYPRLTNVQLAAVPELAAAMKLRGVTP